MNSQGSQIQRNSFDKIAVPPVVKNTSRQSRA